MESKTQHESPLERADSETSVQSVLRLLSVGTRSHDSIDFPLSPAKISRGRLSTRFFYDFVQLVESKCVYSVLRTACIDPHQISHFQLDKSFGTLLHILR